MYLKKISGINNPMALSNDLCLSECKLKLLFNIVNTMSCYLLPVKLISWYLFHRYLYIYMCVYGYTIDTVYILVYFMKRMNG